MVVKQSCFAGAPVKDLANLNSIFSLSESADAMSELQKSELARESNKDTGEVEASFEGGTPTFAPDSAVTPPLPGKTLLGYNHSQILTLQRTIGNKAVQRLVERTRLHDAGRPAHTANNVKVSRSNQVVQRVREEEFKEDPDAFMKANVVIFDYPKGFRLRFPETVKAVGSKIPANNLDANVKNLMAKNRTAMPFYLQDSKTVDTGKKKIYYVTPALNLLSKELLKPLFKNGGTDVEGAEGMVDTLVGESGEETTHITANYAPYFINNPNLKTDGSGDTGADIWDNVGSTVVDPEVTDFVFTDAMNGCAYAITAVEGSDVKFEAWHFQSETDNFAQASHFRATKGIRDWFGVNDYYIGDGTTNLATTNIIWHKGGDWKMLSQKNVVPLNGEGETTFQESTAHPLNVSGEMDEESLDTIHGKLMGGARNGIKKADVDKINEKLEAFSFNATMGFDSIKPFKLENTSMDKNEVNEISKVSGNSGNQLYRRAYDTDLSLFDEIAKVKASLEAIASSGMFGTSYDKAKTIPIKKTFVTEATKLFSQISLRVDLIKRVKVTTDEKTLNEDLLLAILNTKYYYDVNQNYNDQYELLNKVGDELKRLVLKKKGVATKGSLLKAEKETLFPVEHD